MATSKIDNEIGLYYFSIALVLTLDRTGGPVVHFLSTCPHSLPKKHFIENLYSLKIFSHVGTPTFSIYA